MPSALLIRRRTDQLAVLGFKLSDFQVDMEVISKLFGIPATKCVIGSAEFWFKASEL